jgi:erythromycin esterase-like protein
MTAIMASITTDRPAPGRQRLEGTALAAGLPAAIAAAAEPFGSIEEADLGPLLDRIGDARVVLLGEASHGTSEFYRLRARITRALVEERGFRIVALEADWPDAARLDHYVRDLPAEPPPERPFQRFPSWMWANREFLELVHALRRFNEGLPSPDPAAAVGIYGLDLYSLYASIAAVLQYLEDVDPEAARVARERYSCLTPWEGDPATYGLAAVSGRYRECEDDVVAALQDLLDRRLRYAAADGHRFLDAIQNARLVASAERYYRTMYRGSRESWNLRDGHMFETLETLLDFRGPDARAVVWAHNSHLGDASATEMGARGEHNLGQLCRQELGRGAYLVGFGTDRGTVAAAADWGGEMEVMAVRPSHPQSYERLCHESGTERFFLPLRQDTADPGLRDGLLEPRLERAIGVIYRPQTERQSHYFRASLPRQFDEYVWLDETSAVAPLGRAEREGMPDTYPFGL